MTPLIYEIDTYTFRSYTNGETWEGYDNEGEYIGMYVGDIREETSFNDIWDCLE